MGKSVKPQDRVDFSCSTSLQSTSKSPHIYQLRFPQSYHPWYLPPFLSITFFILTIEPQETQKPHSATVNLAPVSALQYSALKFIFGLFPEVEELED